MGITSILIVKQSASNFRVKQFRLLHPKVGGMCYSEMAVTGGNGHCITFQKKEKKECLLSVLLTCKYKAVNEALVSVQQECSAGPTGEWCKFHSNKYQPSHWSCTLISAAVHDGQVWWWLSSQENWWAKLQLSAVSSSGNMSISYIWSFNWHHFVAAHPILRGSKISRL